MCKAPCLFAIGHMLVLGSLRLQLYPKDVLHSSRGLLSQQAGGGGSIRVRVNSTERQVTGKASRSLAVD